MDQVEEIHKKLKELRDLAKEHARVKDDPKCQALCETTSEVLGGLEKSYDHFLQKSEEAWQ